MASFPTSLVTYTNPSATDKLNSPAHATQHTSENNEIIAVETYLGTNASQTTPVAAGKVLNSTSASAAEWTATPTLGVAGTTLGKVTLAGNTSGTTTVQPAAAASGTLTLPAATDTLVGKDTTDTLTNKTLTSPTLTTPVLGTPSSGTLTNCSGLPLSGVTDSTTEALGVGSLEIGHATDTTLTRVSAGVAAIEGVNILTTAGGTLTGEIDLGENFGLTLDAALSADGKYSGIVEPGTLGATIAFGDLCYKDPTDSRWELADANVITAADGDARGTLAICVLAGNDGSATKMLMWGKVRAAAFPAFTVNAQLYVSETAGDITETQPTTADAMIRCVGYALTAEDLFFNPSPDYITHT